METLRVAANDLLAAANRWHELSADLGGAVPSGRGSTTGKRSRFGSSGTDSNKPIRSSRRIRRMCRPPRERERGLLSRVAEGAAIGGALEIPEGGVGVIPRMVIGGGMGHWSNYFGARDPTGTPLPGTDEVA
jgi:hypothetical protein